MGSLQRYSVYLLYYCFTQFTCSTSTKNTLTRHLNTTAKQANANLGLCLRSSLSLLYYCFTSTKVQFLTPCTTAKVCKGESLPVPEELMTRCALVEGGERGWVWDPFMDELREEYLDCRCACVRVWCVCVSCVQASAYVSIRQHTSAYVSIRQHDDLRDEYFDCRCTVSGCSGEM
jgi:hypothetical protein